MINAMFKTNTGNKNIFSEHCVRKKYPYSEFFWSVFSSNAGKYGPENLRIRILLTQWKLPLPKR